MSSYTGRTRRFKKKGDYALLYIGIHSNSGEFHVTLWNLNYVGKQFANLGKQFANDTKRVRQPRKTVRQRHKRVRQRKEKKQPQKLQPAK